MLRGNVIPGTVTIMTSDGGVQTVNTNGFLGYTTDVAITSITMSAAGTTNNWVQVDHFYTGTAAIPEPTSVSLALLGLGGLRLAAYRRRKLN
jgi:PEP-CTERM motif-containing protein